MGGYTSLLILFFNFRFAGFMFTEVFSQQARSPDFPFSLYEGLAGTACFLNDLLQPEKAEFPLSDVFM